MFPSCWLWGFAPRTRVRRRGTPCWTVRVRPWLHTKWECRLRCSSCAVRKFWNMQSSWSCPAWVPRWGGMHVPTGSSRVPASALTPSFWPPSAPPTPWAPPRSHCASPTASAVPLTLHSRCTGHPPSPWRTSVPSRAQSPPPRTWCMLAWSPRWRAVRDWCVRCHPSTSPWTWVSP